jgi:hypothetical protein
MRKPKHRSETAVSRGDSLASGPAGTDNQHDVHGDVRFLERIGAHKARREQFEIEGAVFYGVRVPPQRGFSRLLKNSRIVIARSVFRDAAISTLLISLEPRLLRFACKDGKKTFSETC